MTDSLYGKFTVIKNASTQHTHDGRYFVLSPHTDPFAHIALLSYAMACEGTQPGLAQGIRDWVTSIPKREEDHDHKESSQHSS